MAASAGRRATGQLRRASSRALKTLGDDETLLVQSGKPVGVFRTHADAPRVLIANSNLVGTGRPGTHFHELDRKGLMMYGQMTAGSWIYIGSQGIVQGTYETFVEVGRQHYGGDLARPLDPDRRARRHGRRAAAGRDDGRRLDARRRVPAEPHRAAPRDRLSRPLDDRRSTRRWRSSPRRMRKKQPVSVGLLGNAAEIFPELARACRRQRARPDVVTDQTSAHDPLNGYLPAGWTLEQREQREAPIRTASSAPPRSRWRCRCARCSTSTAGRADARLRQQHPRRWRRRWASPTPSTSRASCRPTSGRCSAAASGRSAGRRCPAIRRTSARPTPR